MFVQPPTIYPDMPPVPGATQHRFEHDGLTWVDLLYPRREHAEYLHERLGLDPAHIEDLLVPLKRPKFETSEDGRYIYLVVHFPALNEQARLPEVSEINLFVGQQFVVTTHDGRVRPLVRLTQTAATERGRAPLMSAGAGGLLCQILTTLVSHTEAIITRLDAQVDALEGQIFQQDTRRIVRDLSYLRRDVISLRRIVRPNLAVFSVLARRDHPALGGAVHDTLGDLHDRTVQMWETLEEQKEIIEGLDATVTSLTSHRLNQEMKIFTLITVIFLPMTLVASILGMNVVIPFADHPASLLGAVVLMIALAGALIGYMRHKGWM